MKKIQVSVIHAIIFLTLLALSNCGGSSHGLIYQSDLTVWMLNPEQKVKKPLIEGVKYASAVSNDFSQIVYSTDSYDLWITDSDGNNARAVITDELRTIGLGIAQVSWAPGDKKLAIWAIPTDSPRSTPDKSALYIADLSTNMRHTVACAVDFEWTRTGEQLIVNKAFCPEAGVYLVSLDGLVIRPLLKDQVGGVASIAVSPVKDEVALVVGNALDQHILITDWLSGNSVELLQSSPEFSYQSIDYLAWSPDGQRLAFIAAVPNKDNLAVSTLFVVNPLTRVRKELAKNIRGPIVWSPQGHAIAATVLTTTKGIYQIDSETGNTQQLTDDRLTSPMNFIWK